MKNVLVVLFVMLCTNLAAQFDLPDLTEVESVDLTVYWGDVTILGGDRNNGRIEISYTNSQSKKRELTASEASQYVSIQKKGRSLEVIAREPSGFESTDFTLFIPSRIWVKVTLIKGGDIYMSDLANGIEVDQRNGSFYAERISDHAMVNLANGSIDIQFDDLEKSLPVSLVTLNGEVRVSLPGDVRRDLRLISNKNGFIKSDFSIKALADIPNINVEEYSKKPIKYFGEINGGGSLLFLSTQNGPLIIEKNE